MTRLTAERREQQEASRNTLREMLPPGTTVPVILRHVSRSGMSRSISVVIDSEDYSWLVARALGEKIDQTNGGIKMQGCGMDMGFALVYNIASALYPNGFTCTGRSEHPNRCPSNDHSNGDRDYSPHRHSSGGYALRHLWL